LISVLARVLLLTPQVEVTDAAVADLAMHCTQLTSLRLEQTYVGDQGVGKVLAACPNLRELRVAGCSTHSWMLPADYMFAGLSVAGLKKVAAVKGAGAKLTSLDLSCLALEQQQEQQEAPVLPAGIAAATVVVNNAANSNGSSNTADAAAQQQAAVTAARSSSSSSSSDAAGGTSSSSLVPLQQAQESLASRLLSPLLLIPAAWCLQLTSLNLDWLKVDGSALQESLVATLQCCSSLHRLSLVGYQGSVDGLLAAASEAAGPRAGIKQLNLQHSQVRVRRVVWRGMAGCHEPLCWPA
jgi:hypothetical protein